MYAPTTLYNILNHYLRADWKSKSSTLSEVIMMKKAVNSLDDEYDNNYELITPCMSWTDKKIFPERTHPEAAVQRCS